VPIGHKAGKILVRNGKIVCGCCDQQPATPCLYCAEGKTPRTATIVIAGATTAEINGTWLMRQNPNNPCTYGDGAENELQMGNNWLCSGTITGFQPFVTTYVVAVHLTVPPYTVFNLSYNHFVSPDDCTASYLFSGPIDGGTYQVSAAA